jgi:hypothetical protein
LERFKDNYDVKELLKQQAKDHQICLVGKLPPFIVKVPEDLTEGRFL